MKILALVLAINVATISPPSNKGYPIYCVDIPSLVRWYENSRKNIKQTRGCKTEYIGKIKEFKRIDTKPLTSDKKILIIRKVTTDDSMIYYQVIGVEDTV